MYFFPLKVFNRATSVPVHERLRSRTFDDLPAAGVKGSIHVVEGARARSHSWVEPKNGSYFYPFFHQQKQLLWINLFLLVSIFMNWRS